MATTADCTTPAFVLTHPDRTSIAHWPDLEQRGDFIISRHTVDRENWVRLFYGRPACCVRLASLKQGKRYLTHPISGKRFGSLEKAMAFYLGQKPELTAAPAQEPAPVEEPAQEPAPVEEPAQEPAPVDEPAAQEPGPPARHWLEEPAPRRLSFPQVRARLADTLLRRYDRAAILYRLNLLGYEGNTDACSLRSLAFKLAYCILPAGPDRVMKGGRA